MNKEELKARVCEVIRRRNPAIVLPFLPSLNSVLKSRKLLPKFVPPLMRSAWTMKRAGASLA